MLKSTTYTIEDSILVVSPMGTLGRQSQVFDFFDDFTQKAAENGAKMILIDEVNLIVALDALDVTMIISQFDNKTRQRLDYKIAAVNSNDVGISHFADIVAESKSIEYKHFSIREEAKSGF